MASFCGAGGRPRPSGQEEAVRQYVRDWATTLGFEYMGDDAGNLVIRAPGRGRGAGSSPVLIQGHMDMVCEKDLDVTHNFETDPIRARRNGDDVSATGTTLGADNGIGVSLAMAACEGLYPDHPPIELLLTADEETGMTGAMGLDATMLSAQRLINLDAEEEGTLYIGCAGAATRWRVCRLSARHRNLAGCLLRSASVDWLGATRGWTSTGTEGTPSGFWLRRCGSSSGSCLWRWCGWKGEQRNAIPRDARCVALVDPVKQSALQTAVTEIGPRLRQLHADSDPGFELTLGTPGEAPADAPSDNPSDNPWTADCAERALELLMTVPDGIETLSATVEGLVETSSNLGVLEIDASKDELVATFCSRSSNERALDAICARIAMITARCGGTARPESRYPGWQPNPGSPLLATARDVFGALAGGVPPKVTAIHAGLECGLLGGLMPGLDMVSFGPEINDAHTPRERVSIRSVEVVSQQLGGLLAALCA